LAQDTHRNPSWHVRRDWLLCVTLRVETNSYMRHDSFICVPWLIYMCAMTYSYVRHDSYVWHLESRLIHICDMTHLYVCHDLFICAPWLICVTFRVETHSYMQHDSFICVPWLIHMCAMTHMCDTLSRDILMCDSLMSRHSYVCRWFETFRCVTLLCVTLSSWDIAMCDTLVSRPSYVCNWVIPMCVVEWRHFFVRHCDGWHSWVTLWCVTVSGQGIRMGWLRLVGFLKL